VRPFERPVLHELSAGCVSEQLLGPHGPLPGRAALPVLVHEDVLLQLQQPQHVVLRLLEVLRLRLPPGCQLQLSRLHLYLYNRRRQSRAAMLPVSDVGVLLGVSAGGAGCGVLSAQAP